MQYPPFKSVILSPDTRTLLECCKIGMEMIASGEWDYKFRIPPPMTTIDGLRALEFLAESPTPATSTPLPEQTE